MQALATDRVHGLALTREEFWEATPRELAAHEKIHERGRRQHAELLAALYNGPLIRKDETQWTPEMFLPGYIPQADESWKAAKRAAMAHQKMTPEQKRQIATGQEQFSEAQSRASRAQARGASREEIVAIMEGRPWPMN